MQIKTRVYAHEAYNLNKYRAFIEPQTLYGNLDYILDFASDELYEHECDVSAVIIHTLDEEVYAVLQVGVYEELIEFHPELHLDESEIDTMAQRIISTKFEPGVVGAIDASYRLCCYALIIQRKANEWVVVGE